MAVENRNLTIERGTDFSKTLTVKINGNIVDLTGYTIVSKVRKHYNSTTSYNFTATVVSAVNGSLKIDMNDTITSSIPFGRYVWDLVITKNNITTKVIKGTVIVEGTASLS